MEDQETELVKGDTLWVPRGAVHWFYNPYDEPCDFLFLYTRATLGAAPYETFNPRPGSDPAGRGPANHFQAMPKRLIASGSISRPRPGPGGSANDPFSNFRGAVKTPASRLT